MLESPHTSVPEKRESPFFTAFRPGRKRLLPLRGAAAATVLLVGFLLLGCGQPEFAYDTAPSQAEADSLASMALKATLPPGSTQVGFTFRIKESDLRFTGRGVARIQPPYNVRLDLFTPQGENLFQAALVEGELRIPDWAPRALAPPAPLLWAAVGVFRPDPSLVMAGARRSSDGGVLLLYDLGEQRELRFGFSHDKLLRAELRKDGHLEEEVNLSYGDDSETAAETVYRNQARFLEMTFTIETVEDVDSFPPDIWYLGI